MSSRAHSGLPAQHVPDCRQIVQREHLAEAAVERDKLLSDALLQVEIDR